MASRHLPRRFSFFDLMLDLLIDLALIGLGLALYYQFEVREIFPVSLSPALTDLVGSHELAVYLICGVPLVIGILSLVRTLARALASLRGG
jgi:hypothetical protein